MSELAAPHRACRLRLDLEGDNRDDIIGALRNIEFLIATDQMTTGCSGGCGSGYIYEFIQNGAPTHDEYFKALTAYLEARRSEKKDKELSSSENPP